MRRYYSRIAIILLLGVVFSQISLNGTEGTDPSPRLQPVSMLEQTKEPENESQVCGDFVYELVDGGARIIKYNGGSDRLSIPSEVDGHTVIEIAQEILDGYVQCEGDTVISDGMQAMGSDPFYPCAITSVYIPSTVTRIQDHSFDESIVIYGDPGSAAERYADMSGCIFLAGKIENPELMSVSTVSSTVIPTSLPTVSSTATTEPAAVWTNPPVMREYGDFWYMVVDDGVRLAEYRGEDEYLSIPSEVDVPYYVHAVSDTVVEIGSGMLDRYDKFKGDLVIPEGVKRIEANAFSGKEFEGKLVLPSSFTDISPYAFHNLSLKYGSDGKELIIPDEVKKIGAYAFANCTWISKDLILPEGLCTIGEKAFSGCTLDGDIYIPSTVVEIQEGAFDSLREGKKIYGASGSEAERYANENGIPFSEYRVCGDFMYELVEDGAKLIKYRGEGENFSIPSAVDGHTVVEISLGRNGYYDVKYHLKGDLIIPDGVKRIRGMGVYVSCEGKLVLPASLTEIYDNAFRFFSCEGELIIPSGVQRIGHGAFYWCRFREGELIIPPGVQKIESSAFCGCDWIRGNLILPDGLCSIGNGAFSGCEHIGDIYIPGTVVTEIGRFTFAPELFGEGGSTIYGVSGSEAERYANKKGYPFIAGEMPEPTATPEPTEAPPATPTPEPRVSGDFVYELVEDGAKIIKYNGEGKRLRIPSKMDGNTVVEIGTNALNGRLNEYDKFEGDLVIPNGVKRIGKGAFFCITFEGKLVLPSTLTEIGLSAFESSSFEEEELILPQGLREIGKYSFGGCSWIKGNLIFPEGLRSIGECAFRASYKIGDIYIPGTVKMIGNDAFFDSSWYVGCSAGTIHGVSGSKAERYAEEFNYDFRVMEIPTATPEPTATPKPTAIPVPTSATGIPVPTITPGPAFLPTKQPAATIMPVQTADSIPVPTITPGSAFTPTQQPAATIMPVQTADSIPVPTITPGSAFTPTQQPAATIMPVQTPDSIPGFTLPPTQRPVVTFMPVQKPVSTTTPTPLPAFAPTPIPAPEAVHSEQLPQILPPPAALIPAASGSPLLNQMPAPGTNANNKKAKAGSRIKKIRSPAFSLKKRRTVSGKRYVSLRLKRYKGTYLEIWVGRKAKGSKKMVFNKLKIKKNNIRNAKGVFNFQYTKQKGTLVFQIRTYMKKGKKRIYSKMSKGKGIRLS